MVGQQVLDLLIGVRIPAPEQSFAKASEFGFTAHLLTGDFFCYIMAHIEFRLFLYYLTKIKQKQPKFVGWVTHILSLGRVASHTGGVTNERGYDFVPISACRD